MRIGIVFNSLSGRKSSLKIHRAVMSAISHHRDTILVIKPDEGERINDAVRRAVPKVDMIVAIGGDGTLNRVVNGVVTSARPDCPVGHLATGRGCDVARTLPSFSIASLQEQSISICSERSVDLGMVSCDNTEPTVFVNISGIGVSGEASAIASRLPRALGSSSYVIGAAKALLTTRPGHLRLMIDGRPTTRDDVLCVVVCNARAFGGGIVIAPDAQPDDGILDIVLIRNANLLNFGVNLGKLKKGDLREHGALERLTGREIRVDETALRFVDADGEVAGNPPATYTVLPGALTWIGPSS